MSKHTPGPWEVDPYEPANIIDAESCRIAVLVGDAADPEQVEECEANARLIAAAPDLLEALEFLLLRGVHDREANAQARAAIAAARGEK